MAKDFPDYKQLTEKVANLMDRRRQELVDRIDDLKEQIDAFHSRLEDLSERINWLVSHVHVQRPEAMYTDPASQIPPLHSKP